MHRAVAGHPDCHLVEVAVGWHVAHADRSIVMQPGGDRANRCFNAMFANLDATHVGQRGHQADGAVTAHAEVAGVVEEDHSGCRVGGNRLTKQGAHDHIVAARLQHGGSAPPVMCGRKQGSALGHTALAKIRKTTDDQPRGFASGVRVDDLYAFHGFGLRWWGSIPWEAGAGLKNRCS